MSPCFKRSSAGGVGWVLLALSMVCGHAATAATTVTQESPASWTSYISPGGSAGTLTNEPGWRDGNWSTYTQALSNGSHSEAIVFNAEETWNIPSGVTNPCFNFKIESSGAWETSNRVWLKNLTTSAWDRVWYNLDTAGTYNTSVAIPSQYISLSGQVQTKVDLFDKHSTSAWSRLYETSLSYDVSATHVLCVGLRDRRGKELRGDVMAERVKDAFAQIPSVKTAWLLPLDAQASDSGQNYIQIRDTITAIRSKMNEGDTFVFFNECHGAYDHNVFDGDNYGGDERCVSAQYVEKVGNVSLYLWNDTTGDEYWELGDNDVYDDDFSGYFTGSEWANINKLFILDTCFSGGFAGSTEHGDTGDLSRLPRFALMAAAPETHFARSHYDSEAGGQVGNMGDALVKALNQLKDEDSITYDDLWQLIQDEAGLYVGSAGSILGFEDGWDSEFTVEGVDMYSTMSSDFEMTLGIPEPATLSLLALGGLGLMLRKRGEVVGRKGTQ